MMRPDSTLIVTAVLFFAHSEPNAAVSFVAALDQFSFSSRPTAAAAAAAAADAADAADAAADATFMRTLLDSHVRVTRSAHSTASSTNHKRS